MTQRHKRLDAIERAQRATKGKRIFVQWDDARGITEGGEPRTQADIDDAVRQGFDVLKIQIVHQGQEG
jgi:hypothetical protein